MGHLLTLFGVAGGRPILPTYYVDTAAANDNGNGLTPATAWKTVSKVDGFAFAAGDWVAFDRGETWREQLEVTHGGSTGQPVTFGAYGTGAKPIVTGGALVAAGSWSQVSGKLGTDANTMGLWDFNGALTDTSAHTRTLTGAGTVAYGATGAPFDEYFHVNTAGDAYYPDAQSGDANAFDLDGAKSYTVEAWIRCGALTSGSYIIASKAPGLWGNWQNWTLGLYHNGVALYLAAYTTDASHEISTKVTDPIVTNQLVDGNWHHVAAVFDFANSVDHKVRLWVDGVALGVGVSCALSTGVANANDMTIGALSGGTDKFPGDIEQLRISDVARTSFPTSTGSPSLWAATLATWPLALKCGNTLGTRKLTSQLDTLASVTQDMDWFWAGGTLYLWCAEGNPATIYGSVDVASRAFAVVSNTNYVTFQDVQAELGGTTGAYGIGIVGSAVGNTVRRCTLVNCPTGIQITPDVGGSHVIENNEISYCHDNGISAQNHQGSGPGTETIVRGNYIHDVATHNIFVNANYWIVEDNVLGPSLLNPASHLAINGWPPPPWEVYGIGVWAASAGEGSAQHNIIRRNIIHGIRSAGQEGTAMESDNHSNDNQFLYNIGYHNDGSGFTAYQAANALAQHNTFHDNNLNSSGEMTNVGELRLGSGPVHTTNATMKDNIAYATQAAAHCLFVDAVTAGETLDIDYNCYWKDGADPDMWSWAGTVYKKSQFAAYKTASGQDAHSIVADPLFVDAANHDYHLAAGSPCIGTASDGGNIGAL